MLRRGTIDMRPHGGRAMRPGAAQGEIHAPLHIGRRPIGSAVLTHGHQGTQPGAIRVFLARPDMALVEMGMQIDKGRQHNAMVEINVIRPKRGAACGTNAGDLAVGNLDIDQNKRTRGGLAHHCCRHVCIGQHVAASRRNSDRQTLILPLDGALMPAMERQPGDKRG